MNLDSDAADDTPPCAPIDTGPVSPARAHLISLGLVGDCAAIRRLHFDVARYAPKLATVLVVGETGSGKELVARGLHELSTRARGPFVAVNVATLRRELTASELFGHERGAFTGAVNAHRGLFEQAHGGTLFLDEIGELDLAAQADLLRVLETREVRPVGSPRTRTVDVRVVAATHRDLAAMVADGVFREDLYYRLNVLSVAVPPLRERVEDLSAIVTHALCTLGREVGTRRLRRDALGVLGRYDWPGNVRQLLNVLRRACARCDDEVLGAESMRDALVGEPTHNGRVMYRPTAQRPLPASQVAESVRRWDGNITRAARELGVARSTVRHHLRTHDTASPTPPRSR